MALYGGIVLEEALDLSSDRILNDDVFLLLYLCVFIVMYALFCIFCFHLANCHSPTTRFDVFPCFVICCKANAKVFLAKTWHGPHSS